MLDIIIDGIIAAYCFVDKNWNNYVFDRLRVIIFPLLIFFKAIAILRKDETKFTQFTLSLSLLLNLPNLYTFGYTGPLFYFYLLMIVTFIFCMKTRKIKCFIRSQMVIYVMMTFTFFILIINPMQYVGDSFDRYMSNKGDCFREMLKFTSVGDSPCEKETYLIYEKDNIYHASLPNQTLVKAGWTIKYKTNACPTYIYISPDVERSYMESNLNNLRLNNDYVYGYRYIQRKRLYASKDHVSYKMEINGLTNYVKSLESNYNTYVPTNVAVILMMSLINGKFIPNLSRKKKMFIYQFRKHIELYMKACNAKNHIKNLNKICDTFERSRTYKPTVHEISRAAAAMIQKEAGDLSSVLIQKIRKNRNAHYRVTFDNDRQQAAAAEVLRIDDFKKLNKKKIKEMENIFFLRRALLVNNTVVAARENKLEKRGGKRMKKSQDKEKSRVNLNHFTTHSVKQKAPTIKGWFKATRTKVKTEVENYTDRKVICFPFKPDPEEVPFPEHLIKRINKDYSKFLDKMPVKAKKRKKLETKSITVKLGHMGVKDEEYERVIDEYSTSIEYMSRSAWRPGYFRHLQIDRQRVMYAFEKEISFCMNL